MKKTNLVHCFGLLALLPLLLVPLSCAKKIDPRFISSATVESKTFQISPTISGQIVALRCDEGDRVAAGDLIAVLDTTPLVLKRQELQALLHESNQNIAAKEAEIRAAQAEVDGLMREYTRIKALADKGSLPGQQADNLETQHSVAEKKLEAARLTLTSVKSRIAVIGAQMRQLEDQIGRCFLVAPASGVVLTRYRNVNEIAVPQSPVFEIGVTDTVHVDFFVPQPLLARISAGNTVLIRLDNQGGSDTVTVPGTVTWIGDQAEFSPKNIQTRDARNELVFRVRAKVANSRSLLKRGLPVEVWFNESGH